MKYFVSIFALLATTTSLHADTLATITTNSERLDEFLLTQLAAPQEVITIMSRWFADNQDIIDTALGYEPMIGSVKPLMDATHKILAEQGLKNLSSFNYVFALPNTQYLVKIAGHVNRKHNLNTLSYYLRYPENPFGKEHYNYSRALTADDYHLFETTLADADLNHSLCKDILVPLKESPKTYQTISRATNYLAFVHAVGKYHLTTVTGPAMYLVHIPGRPTEISDHNYLVVEQFIPALGHIDAVTEQQGKEIDIAVREANLFDYSKTNMFAKDGNIVFVDFEQPNNANPQQFLPKTQQLMDTILSSSQRCN